MEDEWESLVEDDRPEIMPVTVKSRRLAVFFAKMYARLYFLGPEGQVLRKQLGKIPKISWTIDEVDGDYTVNFKVVNKNYRPRKK